MTLWWVLNLLSNDGPEGEDPSQILQTSLNQNLLAWAQASGQQPSFCALDRLALENDKIQDSKAVEEAVESFLYNPLHGGGNNGGPRITGDAVNLYVAIVGDVEEPLTRAAFAPLAKNLRQKQAAGLFSGTSLHVVGLLMAPLGRALRSDTDLGGFVGQLEAMLADPPATRPLKHLILQQARNQTAANPRGYQVLRPGQRIALLAHTLWHLVADDLSLPDSQPASTNDTPCWLAGACGVFWDAEAERHRASAEAGNGLLAILASAEESPFVDEQQAQAAARTLEDALNGQKLCRSMAAAQGMPSLAFSLNFLAHPRNTRGRLISPWHLLWRDLLQVYFRVHLRDLPFRASEHSKLYLENFLRSFPAFLREEKGRLWKGGPNLPGLGEKLREALGGVLRGKYGDARTLSQIIKAAEALARTCEENSTKVESDSLEDFEPLTIPPFLRPHYDRAAANLDMVTEATLWGRIREDIAIHPLPGALLARTALLGLLLAATIRPALLLLSPIVPSVLGLLGHPIWLKVAAFFLPVLISLGWYEVGVIRRLRKHLMGYVGALLRHAQEQARRKLKLAVQELFAESKEYCDSVAKWAKEEAKAMNYPKVEVMSFAKTDFMTDVFNPIQIPGGGAILAEPPKRPETLPKGFTRPYNLLGLKEKNALLNALLDQSLEHKKVCEVLNDLIPTAVSSSDATQSTDVLLGKFMKALQGCVEGLFASLGNQGAFDLLRNDGQINARLDSMACLAWPPGVVQPGQNLPNPIKEAEYAQNLELPNYHHTNIQGTSVFSVAVWQSLNALSDLEPLCMPEVEKRGDKGSGQIRPGAGENEPPVGPDLET